MGIGNYIDGLPKDDYNGIYIKSSKSNWLAAPSSDNINDLATEYNGGWILDLPYDYNTLGFRPVVCLKSDTQLMDNGDNTYSIKEPIIASAVHNEANGTIEITVKYTENGIAKIEDENGNAISFTNENGIIKAIAISNAGTNKFIITDSKGITKELKVAVPYKYGNKVFGYECATERVEWRLFHEDGENIYLIADDYIPYENLPTSTNNNILNNGHTVYTCSAYFTNILNDYEGSAWIRANTNEKARNWITWVNSYPSSTNNNIKAVAYMMDTNKWGENFKGEKAEYAIGGPTLELFCESYKQTHPERYIEYNSMNSIGYQLKWSDGSYEEYIQGLKKDDFNSIYIKSDRNNAFGMWLASLTDGSTDYVMGADSNGRVYCSEYSDMRFGFRPVVCLKSDVKLVDNGDNTYSIKEPITAKAEYNKETNQIEIRVAYSEHGVSKIMLNNTTELSMTNTNGITIANTAGIGLEDEIYTITIIDKKGNTRELKIKVSVPKTKYYGKEVTNYTCEAQGVDKWRVFHVDESDNIYLIADDYVPYANLPTSTAGTALNKGSTNYKAYFTNILSNYTGSAWIRSNTKEEAGKWLSWINLYPNSTNNNIKAVAYMMDTNKWSGFANNAYAEYAIGGPTLEMFCASYKVTHPDKYIECDSTNANGYKVKLNNGSYSGSIPGLTQNDFESIYIDSERTKADGMWIASTSADGSDYVMCADDSGNVTYNGYRADSKGFRPLVCLKSGVKLIDNGDGTCSIQ